MAQCKVIKNGLAKVCVGAMRTMITVYVRTISPPDSGSTDYDLNFAQANKVSAQIETKTNVTMFDNTNTERVVSHVFYIRYIQGVTSESWVELNNEYYDIVSVENIDEKNVWLILNCNKRGATAKVVNYA